MTNDDKYLIEKLAKPRIDWNGPIQLGIVVAVLFGANLPFYFSHRADLREMEKWNKEMELRHREWQERVIKLEEQRKLTKQPISASSPSAS